jgi:3-isopropylmalate/(R)-2-methylmalate dehydratase small subunit
MTDAPGTARPLRLIDGTAIALGGDDIDTDRIIPARFLKGIGYAALGGNVFADERAAARDGGGQHPFDDPRRAGARILLVGKNFGCGSSREHAPKALQLWGIAAVVGESFGEIFAGNGLSIGMPCLRAAPDDLARLHQAAAADAARRFAIDLEERMIRSGNLAVPVDLPDGARAQFLAGRWDATTVLLEAGPAIERTAARLPYLAGWS